MNLDIATLGIVLFSVYLGNGILAILMAWSGRAFPGAWLWVVAQGVLTAAAGLDVLRTVLPEWVGTVGANTLYVVVYLPFAHAVWAFRFREPFPRRLYALVPLVFLAFLAAATWPFAQRALLFSTLSALGAFFAGGVLMWRVPPRYRTANLVTALPFWVVAVANLVRATVNVLHPTDATYLTMTGVNAWFLLGAVLLSTITLFGYFMMSGIRAEQVLALKDVEIDARNRQLVESNRNKDLFFSIIAHDLRGPISGAARYVRKHLFAKMSGLEAKYAEVETLASALEKTNEFLEKLLWWSKAQLEDWVPRREQFDLGPVLDQAVSLVRSLAEMKEIELAIPPGPYPAFEADPESVQIILGNLLSNAVKFTMPGKRVTVEVRAAGPIGLIVITDEGVGMDRATLDRLFRIEDKLTTHGTSGERGSGLGLLLVRSLAERNGGRVSISSEPGRGTRASLSLPLTAGPT